MKKTLRKMFPRRSIELAAAAAGVGLVAWGLFMIYQPLAPICIGAVLLAEVFTSKGGVE